MKKKIFYAFMGAIALLASACSDDKPDTMDITVPGDASGSELKIDVLGGNGTITFDATSDWTAEVSTGDWLTVSPTSGKAGNGTITVSAQPFDVYSAPNGSRIGYITLKCGSFTKSIAVVQSDPQAAEDKGNAETAKVRRLGGEYTYSVPEHAINYTLQVSEPWVSVVSQQSGSFTIKVDENTTAESRNAEVKVMSAGGDAEIVNVSVEQSWRNVEPGEILIEEIYFTATPLPSTGKPGNSNKDQYFLLTNNTDELLYADGMLIIESKNANAGVTWNEFKNPIVNEFCEAATVMRIPGNGTDVALEPGKSLLIASNALNYKEGYSVGANNMKVEMNPDGLDLSKVDFEWYTVSTVAAIQDIDVPEVPNLDIWVCSSNSIFNLHDRGFQSYAIAMAPVSVDKDGFIADYYWNNAEYILHSKAGDFDRTLDNTYKVPNSWVIDAVMCTVPSINNTRQFAETLDAGWTWASPQDVDNDAQRYGHSVLRNRDANGKLVDTNNSLNDFTPNSTPSIKGK